MTWPFRSSVYAPERIPTIDLHDAASWKKVDDYIATQTFTGKELEIDWYQDVNWEEHGFYVNAMVPVFVPARVYAKPEPPYDDRKDE